MDKDFGELVYKSGLNHKSFLLLRLEDGGSEEKLSAVKYILKTENDFNNFVPSLSQVCPRSVPGLSRVEKRHLFY